MRPKHYKKTGLDTSDMKAYAREYQRLAWSALPEDARKAESKKRTAQRRARREANPDLAATERSRARELAKLARATPEGRAHLRSLRRVNQWATWLRLQLKKSAKARGLAWHPEITTAWIHAQFEKQDGKCFYTGIPFAIVEAKRGIRRPSLDRLDSSKGYEPSNLVLCLCAVNYMKNDYTLEEFSALLEDIRTHRPS